MKDKFLRLRTWVTANSGDNFSFYLALTLLVWPLLCIVILVYSLALQLWDDALRCVLLVLATIGIFVVGLFFTRLVNKFDLRRVLSKHLQKKL